MRRHLRGYGRDRQPAADREGDRGGRVLQGSRPRRLAREHAVERRDRRQRRRQGVRRRWTQECLGMQRARQLPRAEADLPGQTPRGNRESMDGVLVVDKPEGLTSHDVVAAARRLLGEKRIGHTGTLDPLATGVLPLACGRATRLVRFLSAAEKEYGATILVAATTETLDVTGEEISRSRRVPSRETLVAALEFFAGEQLQVPPAYSAKKIAGRRAYELARRDEAVALDPVAVCASRLELLEWGQERCRIALTCSAGFYVRALVRDLGERCGTGACLEA